MRSADNDVHLNPLFPGEMKINDNVKTNSFCELIKGLRRVDFIVLLLVSLSAAAIIIISESSDEDVKNCDGRIVLIKGDSIIDQNSTRINCSDVDITNYPLTYAVVVPYLAYTGFSALSHIIAYGVFAIPVMMNLCEDDIKVIELCYDNATYFTFLNILIIVLFPLTLITLLLILIGKVKIESLSYKITDTPEVEELLINHNSEDENINTLINHYIKRENVLIQERNQSRVDVWSAKIEQCKGDVRYMLYFFEVGDKSTTVMQFINLVKLLFMPQILPIILHTFAVLSNNRLVGSISDTIQNPIILAAFFKVLSIIVLVSLLIQFIIHHLKKRDEPIGEYITFVYNFVEMNRSLAEKIHKRYVKTSNN